MDSLTQIVLGAAVGEKILGRKIGNRAMLYGAIAGTIPDLDVLVGKLFDPVTAVAIHRGFSHSILFFLLLSPLLGWLISKREKDSKVSVMNGAGLVFWALFTHALLDAFTTWGTQLLWPSTYKFAFKSIFVIDPLYTVPFIICLIAAMWKERTDYKRTQWNILGLKISTGYLLITLLLKGITYYKFRQALLDAKIEYAQMETKPSPFNTILWTANVETADAYLIGDYSFFDSQPITFKAYPKNHQLLGSLSGTKTVNRLIAISEGWYTISEKGGKLYFNDLRFGLLNPDENNPQFAFSYELLPENGALTVREVPKSKKDGMLLLQKLWNRIGGN